MDVGCNMLPANQGKRLVLGPWIKSLWYDASLVQI